MRGYTTTAVHGFFSGMFDRNRWYPRIGFKNMHFGEALTPQMKREYGRTFRGACDADLPADRAGGGRNQGAELYLFADAQHAYPGGARRSAD
jgi:hypothetical protein